MILRLTGAQENLILRWKAQEKALDGGTLTTGMSDDWGSLRSGGPSLRMTTQPNDCYREAALPRQLS